MSAISRPGLFAVLVVSSWSCDHDDSGGVVPTAAQGLGDLAAEAAFTTSSSVVVREDPSLPDTAIARIVDHQRQIVLRPSAFFSLPEIAQSFVLYHEYGHHYLRHETSVPCKESESMADAYGIRVLLAKKGVAAAETAIDLILSGAVVNCLGDATHRTCVQRATYARQVLDAALFDSTSVPPAPFPACPPQAVGTLIVTNPTLQSLAVFIDFTNSGVVLAPGAATSLQLFPRVYRVDLVDFFGFPALSGAESVFVGEITLFP